MTGILVAMEQEFSRLAGTPFGKDVTCALTGIGKVNAARAATEMILKYKPDAIVNSGIAGGMAAGILPLDVVIATKVAYHDVWCGEGNDPGQVQGLPRFFEADPTLLAAARAVLREKGLPFHEGLVCSGDQFFVSLEEDARIRSLYPEVLAADMESAAIAQVCRHYGVPFLNFRLVSDTHGSEQEQASTYSHTMADFSNLSLDILKDLTERI